VTSATTIIFGKKIWDPVVLVTRFKNPAVLILAMISLCVATLATNIAANVVSPANDFAHLAPRKISFRLGGFITGVVGILMMPWKLLANPSIYIFDWLGGYSALLGPIGGILIADYYVYRRRELDLMALYQTDGKYHQTGGFSLTGLTALVMAILPNLPGFLVTIHVVPQENVAPIFMLIYSYAWFVGFAAAFVIYLLARQLQKQ